MPNNASCFGSSRRADQIGNVFDVRHGRRSCKQYGLLLARERIQCGRYKRLVGWLEFHDDSGRSWRTDACFTGRRVNGHDDNADIIVERGKRRGVI